MVFLRWLLGIPVALLLIAQVVPFGRNHTNPPVTGEPPWDRPETRAFAVRACYPCHSNETVWPWYSNVAPASWLIQRDVDEGRRKLNYSEWNRPQEEARESAEQVQKGKMPQWYYTILHPTANLSADERASFIRGLQATFGQGRGEERARR